MTQSKPYARERVMGMQEAPVKKRIVVTKGASRWKPGVVGSVVLPNGRTIQYVNRETVDGALKKAEKKLRALRKQRATETAA